MTNESYQVKFVFESTLSLMNERKNQSIYNQVFLTQVSDLHCSARDAVKTRLLYTLLSCAGLYTNSIHYVIQLVSVTH